MGLTPDPHSSRSRCLKCVNKLSRCRRESDEFERTVPMGSVDSEQAQAVRAPCGPYFNDLARSLLSIIFGGREPPWSGGVRLGIQKGSLRFRSSSMCRSRLFAHA